MSINSHVVKSTIVGALGGLLFGFDTAVISGTTSALTQAYHLTPALLGITVSSALAGTVIGAMSAGIPGQKYGRRDSLRVMAIFYVLSAIGCAFAWSWPALIFFRFLGGLGIGGSSVLGPMYIAEIAPPDWRGRPAVVSPVLVTGPAAGAGRLGGLVVKVVGVVGPEESHREVSDREDQQQHCGEGDRDLGHRTIQR